MADPLREDEGWVDCQARMEYLPGTTNLEFHYEGNYLVIEEHLQGVVSSTIVEQHTILCVGVESTHTVLKLESFPMQSGKLNYRLILDYTTISKGAYHEIIPIYRTLFEIIYRNV